MNKPQKIRLMAHLVAGYPSLDESFTVARALQAGGADILELQLPFSDPAADGPVIQEACAKALSSGTKVEDGFRLLERIRKELEIPVFLMSYANLVVRMGVEKFVRRAKSAGAAGLIVPDLTPGYDEGLYEAGRGIGIEVVPVLTTGTSASRLESILSERPRYLYCALRSGITGALTRPSEEALYFLDALGGRDMELMAGFGIRKSEQVRALQGHADIAVAGSVFVREIHDSSGDEGSELFQKIKSKAGELSLRY
ncbi:MAG TPA: tryptophan synthase subunit alpha [Sediminispirochaeta sp.]|nr:tryptophan synthase subunit alpha [Sediminispirochaeta sp.]